MSLWLGGLGVIIGVVVGSFAATVAVRAGKGQGALSGRSACDHCGVSLRFVRTIPVVSGLLSGGNCHACKGPIDPLHMVGELAGAIILGLVCLWVPLPQLVPFALLSLCLLTLALIDSRIQRLPDPLVLAVAALSGGIALMDGVGVFNLLVAVSVGIGLWLIRFVLEKRSGQAALGLGDIKLCAALGLWLGPSVVHVLLLASVSGLVYALVTRQTGRMAFGPFLAGAALCIGLVPYSPWAEGMAWWI
ncbi:prepilin peptidase [Asticcacaulis tiandongensis]|uniref:prepilin peptidase n=1 Tax=Asticcacaulis tiandongensis TaxID=2565365 RepID=UPI00112BF398|nr:A24 family peptidase [Asticcacaulis tiandongensis]